MRKQIRGAMSRAARAHSRAGTRSAYDPLRDPHLAPFFSSPTVLNRLFDAGLIDVEGRPCAPPPMRGRSPGGAGGSVAALPPRRSGAGVAASSSPPPPPQRRSGSAPGPTPTIAPVNNFPPSALGVALESEEEALRTRVRALRLERLAEEQRAHRLQLARESAELRRALDAARVALGLGEEGGGVTAMARGSGGGGVPGAAGGAPGVAGNGECA
jgi:hypothetical protein